MSDVFLTAAKELTIGLKYLGILKGPLPQLMKKQAYRPYFPHGIGHSLGIDVHDVALGANDRVERLEKGMVITIEPGLYFSKPVGPLPACGVRIEDDVLVGSRGAEVLTAGVFPKGLEHLLSMR
jgi:Xaa-Pro aminopeptidase